jgi:hypothetical protein
MEKSNTSSSFYTKENLIELRNEMKACNYDAYVIPHSDSHDVKENINL